LPGGVNAYARGRFCPVAGRVPKESSVEGSTQRENDVREVPDHPPARQRARDLHQPAPQAAAGI